MNLDNLGIKIFADGPDTTTICELAKRSYISGFTTNPTLMRRSGVLDYELWARYLAETVYPKPISFEVLSDDFNEMARQAEKISGWGKNVYAKIPITNTQGHTALPLVQKLLSSGIQVNVTAITTGSQLNAAYASALMTPTPAILSVFAGRIADTGVDPYVLLRTHTMIMFDRSKHPSLQVLWASAREILNIFQARDSKCDIITLPYDLVNKSLLIGKDLDEFSLETVKQFYDDALASGYKL